MVGRSGFFYTLKRVLTVDSSHVHLGGLMIKNFLTRRSGDFIGRLDRPVTLHPLPLPI